MNIWPHIFHSQNQTWTSRIQLKHTQQEYLLADNLELMHIHEDTNSLVYLGTEGILSKVGSYNKK